MTAEKKANAVQMPRKATGDGTSGPDGAICATFRQQQSPLLMTSERASFESSPDAAMALLNKVVGQDGNGDGSGVGDFDTL